MRKVTVAIPAIVDRKTWERARERLQKNRRYTRPPKNHYLLRGLIQCECGASYCGLASTRAGGHNYRCIARYDYRRLHREPCKSVTIHGEELEAVIWADIESFARDPRLVADELTGQREPTEKATAAQLAEVDQSIAERRGELDRYLRLYGRGTIPVEELDAKAAEVRGHLAALNDYRSQLLADQRELDRWEHGLGGIIEALSRLRAELDAGLDFDGKRRALELLVRSITVATKTDAQGHKFPVAHVVYRFECPPMKETPIPIEMSPVFSEQESNWQTRGECFGYLAILC